MSQISLADREVPCGAERQKYATADIFKLLNSTGDLHELMRLVTLFLKDWSGCDAVGIRLREGEDFPYFETRGLPAGFVRAENRLCSMNEQGEVLRDACGNPVLECMCGHVICGRFDPSHSFFTPGGSFWTNSTTRLLACTTVVDRAGRTRNRCNGEGYESVALIPLRFQENTYGLLQFNDQREGRFTPDLLSFLETVGSCLAMGLANHEAAEALQASERRYRRITQALTDYIFTVRVESGQVVETIHGPGCEAVTGYPAEAFAADPFLWIQMVHEEDRAAVRQQAEWILTKGNTDSIKHRIRRRDGELRWVVNTLVANYGPDGRVCSYDGLIHDITERQVAEDALQESEERWKFALEGAGDGVWDWNLQTGRVFFSWPWKSMLGYAQDEISDALSEWVVRVHPDDKDRVHAEIKRHLEGGSPAYVSEHRVRCKDGTYKWTLDRGQVMSRTSGGEPLRMIGTHTDISERRRAQEQLQKSEEDYRSLFENMLDGIAVHRMIFEGDQPVDFVYLMTNRAFETLTGLHDVVGRRVTEVIPGLREDHPELFQLYGRVALTGRPERYELYVKTIDAWFSISAYGPERGYFVALFDNITERKVTEAALHEREASLKAAQRLAQMGSWQWDIATDTARWSDETFRISGLTPDRLNPHRQSFMDLIHPEDRSRVDRALTAALSGASDYDLDYRILLSDGSEKVIHAQAEVFRNEDGQPVMMRGTVQDITERKRVEVALREGEQRLKNVLNTPVVAVRIGDDAGRIIDANDAFVRLVGYTRAELLDGGVTWHDLTPPEYAALDRHGLEEVELHGVFGPYEKEAIRKDGTRVPLLVGISRLPGKTLQHVAFLLDISDRKRAEAERAHLEEQMREVEKLNAIGRLAAQVAHDFNNLLTVIRGQTDLAFEMVGGGHPAQEALAVVQFAADQAAGMTRSLLTFSRITPDEKRILDLGEVLREIQPLLRHSLSSRVILEVEAAQEHLYRVRADRAQLHQVIMNLVINARDAMPDGGVLRVELSLVDEPPGPVNPVPSSHSPAWIRLSVADTGMGMTPEVRSRIFEPFFTTKPLGQGTGLGLSIVYGVVENHGGKVEVESRVGAGTRFVITLPGVSPQPPPELEVLWLDHLHGHGEGILLVLHDPHLGGVLTSFLETLGYRVMRAYHLRDLFEQLRRHKQGIGAIIVDGECFADDRIADLQRLRTEAARVPIIIMGGGAEPHLGQVDDGMVILPREFSMPHLAGIIHDSLAAVDGQEK